MDNKLPIDDILIEPIDNGYLVRVSFIDKSAEVEDRWTSVKHYFATIEEVLAFIETNLD